MSMVTDFEILHVDLENVINSDNILNLIVKALDRPITMCLRNVSRVDTGDDTVQGFLFTAKEITQEEAQRIYDESGEAYGTDGMPDHWVHPMLEEKRDDGARG